MAEHWRCGVAKQLVLQEREEFVAQTTHPKHIYFPEQHVSCLDCMLGSVDTCQRTQLHHTVKCFHGSMNSLHSMVTLCTLASVSNAKHAV